MIIIIYVYIRYSPDEYGIIQSIIDEVRAGINHPIQEIITEMIPLKSNKYVERRKLLLSLTKDDILVIYSPERLAKSIEDYHRCLGVILMKRAGLYVLTTREKFQNDGESDLCQWYKYYATMKNNFAAMAHKERMTAKGDYKGVRKGRARGSISLKKNQLKSFVTMYNSTVPIRAMAQFFGVTRSTLYRWIKELQLRGVITEERQAPTKEDLQVELEEYNREEDSYQRT